MFKKVISKNADAALALNAALRFLTRREYSYYELKSKLLERFTIDAAQQALDKCIQENWQSDARYAQMLVRHCSFSKYGILKLQVLCKQKHVDFDLCKTECDEINWEDLALSALQKKYGENYTLDYNEKRKALNFLYRRGFLPAQCIQALKLFESAPYNNV